jgi:FolB domain-containing protein
MDTDFETFPKRDAILVSKLELSSRIGVPDEERSEPQRLTLNIELLTQRNFSELGDDLSRTVDYFALTRRIQRLAAQRPRHLIETLVDEIAACILTEFPVAEVGLELRKYILADTEFVAVRVRRKARLTGDQ